MSISQRLEKVQQKVVIDPWAKIEGKTCNAKGFYQKISCTQTVRHNWISDQTMKASPQCYLCLPLPVPLQSKITSMITIQQHFRNYPSRKLL